MQRKLSVIGSIAILSAVVAVSGQTVARQPQTGAAGVTSAVAEKALLDQYCVTCHSEKAKNAGGQMSEAARKLTFDSLDTAHVRDHAEEWEKIVRKLRAGMMPPSGMRRPDAATLESMIGWLESELDRNTAVKLPPPGLHRLNRTEYTNVIRDLLAIDIDATKFLPSDDSTHGFDNMAGTLTLSPALLEAYISAAGKISRLAVGDVSAPTQTVYNVPVDTTQNYHVEGLPFGTRGGTIIHHVFPVDGEYAMRIYTVKKGNMGGSGAFGGVRGEKLDVSLDGERIGLVDWDRGVQASAGAGEPGTINLKFSTKAGPHTIGVTFLATNLAPLNDLNEAFSRTTIETGGIEGFTFFPHVGSVRIEGPYNSVGALDTPSRKKIFICRPSNTTPEERCALQIVSNLARHAFRQPPNAEDMEGLMEVYKAGRKNADFDHGIEMALRAILAEPKFIYRAESEPVNLAAGQTYRISDIELASRLSFFLWSSSPDDELMNVASQGKLKDPAVLQQQVKRMLADSKAEALVANFAGQWLNLRGLQASYPDVPTFPDFDDNLRQAMRREAELFFGSIVREDRNILDLLTADYTFVNERLAKHYGIPNVYGSQFRRVTLGNEFDARRGLLGKGAVQVVSAQPFRTSPVGRGKWVMQTLLGISPPDPPPVVPKLEETKSEPGQVFSLRQQMEKHRSVEPCASCHKIMDPIGFSLENFNGIGMWRSDDNGVPIDASGQLVDGTKVTGPAGLRQALMHYSPQFARVVSEKLMTYALGRGVEYYDMPLVRSIVRDAERNDYRFSSIVLGIVKSAPFQMNMKVQPAE
jgi:mono/diheme cytochrome c family protein